MKNIFTKHPNSINESYLKHAFEAFFLSFRMIFTGLAMIVHAVFPFLFTNTASNTVMYFYARFNRRFEPLRKRAEEPQVETQE